MNLIKNKLTTNSLYNIKLGVNYLTKYNIGSKTWLNRHINDDFVKKSQLVIDNIFNYTLCLHELSLIIEVELHLNY